MPDLSVFDQNRSIARGPQPSQTDLLMAAAMVHEQAKAEGPIYTSNSKPNGPNPNQT